MNNLSQIFPPDGSVDFMSWSRYSLLIAFEFCSTAIFIGFFKFSLEFGAQILLLEHQDHWTVRLIGLVCRVFANGPGDLGSMPGGVIPKTLKIVLDTSLLNTQQYKVRIKGKVEQSRKRNRALPYTSV